MQNKDLSRFFPINPLSNKIRQFVRYNDKGEIEGLVGGGGIIDQDLNDPAFVPEKNTYYRHIGITSFPLNVSIVGGSYSGPQRILENQTIRLTITPEEGYSLPEDVEVIGATYSYDSISGVLSLSNAQAAVYIAIECIMDLSLVAFSSRYTLPSKVGIDPTVVSSYDINEWLNNIGGMALLTCDDVNDIIVSDQSNGVNILYIKLSDYEKIIFAADITNWDGITIDKGWQLVNYNTREVIVIDALSAFDNSISGYITNIESSLAYLDGVVIGAVRQPSYPISITVADGYFDGDTSIVKDDIAKITVYPNSSYALPESILVENADYEYDSSTGEIILFNAISNPIVRVDCEVVGQRYNIVVRADYATISGSTYISEGGSATIVISPQSGYTLPQSIAPSAIQNADFVSYTIMGASTGILVINNPVNNVTVTILCETQLTAFDTNVGFNGYDFGPGAVNGNFSYGIEDLLKSLTYSPIQDQSGYSDCTLMGGTGIPCLYAIKYEDTYDKYALICLYNQNEFSIAYATDYMTIYPTGGGVITATPGWQNLVNGHIVNASSSYLTTPIVIDSTGNWNGRLIGSYMNPEPPTSLTPFENGDLVSNMEFDVNIDTNTLDNMIADAISASGSDRVTLMEVLIGGSQRWGLIEARRDQIYFVNEQSRSISIYDTGRWTAINDPDFGTFDETTGIANITNQYIVTATFDSALSAFNGVVFGKIPQ